MDLAIVNKKPNRRLLVVEDELGLQELLKDFLLSKAYEVLVAADLNTALRLIQSQNFDLIISDVFLGSERRGGIQILEAARSLSTPVILLSGNADVDILKQSVNLGCNYFIEKPFSMTEISSAIENVFNTDSDFQTKIQVFVEEFSLSPREAEVLELLAKGLNNREIAGIVKSAERTVKAHISMIFRKSKTSSRTEVLSLLFT
ncbi:MAG: hypothetical protein COV44_01125 [Deltaproteobacteria bacterium CG11_big_fil_rev_8_21_14_0_20_45_16]|nr:MAG: hypothetical protein COV44_01125 [Deltaproteobacteria bacterium CG11_big_fil_rev_8_21_14_0_20_45_16]